MYTSQHIVETIKERALIVDVISKVVKLKQSSRSYTGLCPFHGEKTPSFHVFPETNHYHCFGCHEHGDVISFVQKHYQLDFKEACEQLAHDLGIEISWSHREQLDPHHEILEALNLALTLFKKQFQQQLHNPIFQKFLESRDLDQEQIHQTCQLGWSGKELPELLKKRFNDQVLEQAGLIYEYQGQMKPRFFQRLLFPIINQKGQVLGFGGRKIDPLSPNSKAPKYLNSPETLVFKKSYLLYGLQYLAPLRKKPWIVIVEGYTDVIQCIRASIPAVAPMGTAITIQQIEHLLKMNKELVFCFDGDKAGEKASEKALEYLLPLFKASFDISFILLPQGQDPDQILTQQGKEAFFEICRSRVKFVDFFFSQVGKQYPPENVDSSVKFKVFIRQKIRTIQCPDTRRAMEESLFHFTRRQYRPYKPGKNIVSKNPTLPKLLSTKDLILSLLQSDQDLQQSLDHNDKNLLEECDLNLSKVQAVSSSSENTLLLLKSSQELKNELEHQLWNLEKYATIIFLLQNHHLIPSLSDKVKNFLHSLEDPFLSKTLSLNQVNSPDQNMAQKVQKISGLDKYHSLSPEVSAQEQLKNRLSSFVRRYKSLFPVKSS